MKVFNLNDERFTGRSVLEKVRGCVIRTGLRKLRLHPSVFQVLQDMLVGSSDPTLRAEWDATGERCALKFAIGGYGVTVQSDEHMPEAELVIE